MVEIEKTAGGRVSYRALQCQLSSGDRVDVSEGIAATLCDERGTFKRVSSAASSGGLSDSTTDTGTDAAFTELDGVGEATADALRDAGYESITDVRKTDPSTLAADVDGIGASLASDITGK